MTPHHLLLFCGVLVLCAAWALLARLILLRLHAKRAAAAGRSWRAASLHLGTGLLWLPGALYLVWTLLQLSLVVYFEFVVLSL